MNEIAQLKIVSKHLTTTIPPTYAVRKQLILPHSDTFESLIDAGRVKYRVAFTDNLENEQRIYHIPLDLFKWPSTIFLRTPNTRVYKSKYRAGIDVLISSTHVPDKIFLQLEYDFRYWSCQRLPIIIHVDLDGKETMQVDLHFEEEEVEKKKYGTSTFEHFRKYFHQTRMTYFSFHTTK